MHSFGSHFLVLISHLSTPSILQLARLQSPTHPWRLWTGQCDAQRQVGREGGRPASDLYLGELMCDEKQSACRWPLIGG